VAPKLNKNPFKACSKFIKKEEKKLRRIYIIKITNVVKKICPKITNFCNQLKCVSLASFAALV